MCLTTVTVCWLIKRPQLWRLRKINVTTPETFSQEKQRRMASPSPHDRSRKDEEDDPVDQMISRTGCVELHYAVQECMAEKQDWRACQDQVKTFKDCMTSFQHARKQQLMKHQAPS